MEHQSPIDALCPVVLDTLPEHIAILDASGTMIYVNRAWKRFCDDNGGNATCLDGANYLDTCRRSRDLGAPEADGILQGLGEVLAGRSPGFELEYPCHSQTERRFFRVFIRPLPSVDGHLHGAVVTHINITGQRALEVFRGSFSAAALGVALFSVAGTLEFANPLGRLALGVAEHAQLEALDLFTDLRFGEDHLRRLRTGGTITDQRQQADGLRRFELTVSPFSLYGGSDEGFLMVAQDVTARHQAEASLRRAERADLLGQLALGLAHDLNNDLSSMLGFADLISSQTEDAKIHERIHKILVAGRHAAGLARNLLSMTRTHRSAADGINLEELIDEVAGMLERVLDRRITIHCEHGAMGSIIQGDADQLHSALLNLAINARDAMPEGGELHIRSRVAELTGEEAAACTPELTGGRYALVSFTDTGMGMEESVLSRIFDPFFTTKAKGSGLGLPSVLACMRQHGGGLAVRTQPGTGSSFTLVLPLTAGRPHP